MKRSITVAFWVLMGLLAVTAVLAIAALKYGAVCFWAAMFAALGQTVLAALAWWGLRLARQQAALVDEAEAEANVKFTPLAPLGAFHMSYSDETASAAAATAPVPVEPEDITTLDTGFQRVIVGLTAFGFLVLAGIIGLLVYRNFAAISPGHPIVISPVPLDPGAVVAAGTALLIYILLIPFSRPRPETEGLVEASNSIVILGIPGAVVLLAAVFTVWAKVQYASQAAAIFIGAVLVLQAFELGLNSLRSHGGIVELDQAGVDLQQLPLVPMLSSGWIVGIRVLVAESIGMASSGTTVVGIFSRLIPRVLIAGFIFVVLLSTLHVVPTGDVGIREHLGVTTQHDLEHPLHAGLHILWPWPIDKLQYEPTDKVNLVVVGSEERSKTLLGPNAFSFWSQHPSIPDQEFLTGDVNPDGTPASQMLDGFVAAWWRVKNPGEFFHNISTSDIIEVGGLTGAGSSLHLRRMDTALIHQVLLYAVTRVLSQHTLKQIMEWDVGPVSESIKKVMQDTLNKMKSGIVILSVEIKDIHPPRGQTQMTAQGKLLGPAEAFENVVAQREVEETLIDNAQTEAYADVSQAKGYAKSRLLAADGYATKVVNLEEGRAKALTDQSDAFAKTRPAAMAWEFYQALGKMFGRVNKVVLGPDVTPPEIWQIGHREGSLMVPPPPSGPPGGLGSSPTMGGPGAGSSGASAP
ncbi:MAG: SPFH domain-containing protein [Planctomycetia bacterium]|nr:SPFH domain-containing protein [Planctomycetia bacterium]